MHIPTPFDDVQAFDRRKRHVRLPELLLYSRRHSATAVTLYSLCDVMGGNWGPVEAERPWLAWRVGLSSVDGLAKAIRSLSKPHAGKRDIDPDLPVFVQSVQRGYGKTALRRTVPGIPYVEVPEWTLGDSEYGLLVSAALWRLYVILLHKRVPGRGTVALKRRELAHLARVREDSLPDMIRSLEAARLVVKLARPGQETVFLPVTVQLSEVEYKAVAERLAAVCGKPAESCGELTEPCGQSVDDEAGSSQEGTAPHPSEGTAPHSSEGTAPHPSEGTSIERVLIYGDFNYVDPAVRRAAPSGRANRANPEADAVEDSSPSATADEVGPPPSWRSLVDQFRVVAVDDDRRARTRALIEEARAAAAARHVAA